mgnify:CR=1 FL=1
MKSSINTNVTFTDIQKQTADFLKDSDALKTSFKFSVEYTDQDKKEDNKKDREKSESSKTAEKSKDGSPKDKNEISLEGFLLLSVSKDESKEFLKSWKNKEVPKDKVLPLYNFILKKCSIKALQLEEDLGLPLHVPFPQVRPGPN